jgi:hypothetical protein
LRASHHPWKWLEVFFFAQIFTPDVVDLLRCFFLFQRQFVSCKQSNSYIFLFTIKKNTKNEKKFRDKLRKKSEIKNRKKCKYFDYLVSDSTAASDTRSEVQECAIAVGLLMFGIILERFIEVLRESMNIGGSVEM